MTKQIKVYAGSDTYEKWQQTCERFSSNTAAFAVVVENYYNQIKQEDTMNTVTLSKGDLADWITGTGAENVDEATIDSEITRYTDTLEKTLGEGWRVEVSEHVLGTRINGMPTRVADDDIREALADAEAYVSERFW